MASLWLAKAATAILLCHDVKLRFGPHQGYQGGGSASAQKGKYVRAGMTKRMRDL